jgi:hypothetical protein
MPDNSHLHRPNLLAFEILRLGGLVSGGRLQQAGDPLAGRDLVEFSSL